MRARARTFGDFADSHANNYNFLRFALASLVICAHGVHALNRTSTFHDPLFDLSGQVQLGHLAVYGFFAISGCLVMASWQRSSGPYDYFRKRVLRIYPGFVVCWLVCILVIAPLSGLTWAEYSRQVNVPLWLVKIALLRGFGGLYTFPHNPEHILNTSLWTIPYEFGCYIMLAVLGRLGWLRPTRLAILASLSYAAVVLGSLSELRLISEHPALKAAATVVNNTAASWPLCFFLIGATFYVLRRRIPFSPWIALSAACLFAYGVTTPPWLHVVLPPCVSYLLFYFAYQPRVKLHGFGRGNDLSYGVYLYGWPVQQVLTQLFEFHLNAVGLFCLTMPTVSSVAYVSWKLVEQPFLRMKGARRPARVATQS